jgi:N-acyl-D-amino-acid deacylase
VSRTPGRESYDCLIRGALVLDGGGGETEGDVAIADERIVRVAAPGSLSPEDAEQTIDARGLALAPGFIDAHAHDDSQLLDTPELAPKLSQGVTTVVVGNCGISAAPVTLAGEPPDPMNLLGPRASFAYPTFAAYVAAVAAARPAVNVAALVGHTALRSNHLDRLDRAATPQQIEAMQSQLREALDHGALGLSSGLAYASAQAAPTEELVALADPLAEARGIYCTHLRSEFAPIREALEEALRIGREARVRVIVSHLKCAGVDNHGRSEELLAALDDARAAQAVGWDCYPYTASSSTLDLAQVDERIEIGITWSQPHPELGGRRLAEIASTWGLSQREAARRLQPAGAVYHGMAVEDVERFLRHPETAIGSDGLPRDPRPHPRLWGSFPRVLGHYVRERRLFPLAEAVRRMSGLTADRFSLAGRGYVREGCFADLVLFDPARIRDAASFEEPRKPAEGIRMVFVNGVASWAEGRPTSRRAGRFLPRTAAGATASS